MRLERIKGQRKRARESLVHQAECMVKRSRVEHVAGNPLDNVTIPIPLVDRRRGDPRKWRNIIGVILDRDDDMHRMCCSRWGPKGQINSEPVRLMRTEASFWY